MRSTKETTMSAGQLSESDCRSKLIASGFHVLPDGNAVIVIGERERIPLDRPVGAFDLQGATRARRFATAKDAMRLLIETSN